MRTLLAFLALSSAAAAQVTATGNVYYEDRTYTQSGFGATVNRPVRQAEIELQTSGGAFLTSGVTDENGGYSLTFAGPDQDVRIRVFTRRTDGTGKINAVVKNTFAGDATYAFVGTVFNTASPPAPNDTVILSTGIGGAFNIFDCAVKSFQYLASIEPTLPDFPPDELTIYWQALSSNGTFFDSGVPGIFLLGTSADPDQYDDDIILHEIGHWVTFIYSRDDTPGGPHSVTDQLDPRLSWSEGFAHYWSSAVRRYVNAAIAPPEYASPSQQVDNFQSGNSVFDVEGPSFPTQAVMATNELAVAAVLWDLIDPANETFDLLTNLEGEVWRALSVRIPALPPLSNITLEDFHEGLAQEAAGSMANISGDSVNVRIFNDRRIRYYDDPSEPNNGSGSAPSLTGLLALRTFHPAGDHDWFTVDVTTPGTLQVQTLNLGDGADTKLELYDATGTTLLESNDNRGSNDKSSRIRRGVSTPTTFKVRVLENDSIVQFGYYDLQFQMLPKSGKSGDDGCGLTGIEAVLLLALLRRLRRR